jgi:hypothetical protein
MWALEAYYSSVTLVMERIKGTANDEGFQTSITARTDFVGKAAYLNEKENVNMYG